MTAATKRRASFMYTFVLFSLKDPAAFREILEFPRIARSVLPPGLCETPIVQCWWRRFVLFAWYREGDHNARARALVNPGVLSSEGAGSIFCGGYAGPEMLGSADENQN